MQYIYWFFFISAQNNETNATKFTVWTPRTVTQSTYEPYLETDVTADAINARGAFRGVAAAVHEAISAVALARH